MLVAAALACGFAFAAGVCASCLWSCRHRLRAFLVCDDFDSEFLEGLEEFVLVDSHAPCLECLVSADLKGGGFALVGYACELVGDFLECFFHFPHPSVDDVWWLKCCGGLCHAAVHIRGDCNHRPARKEDGKGAGPADMIMARLLSCRAIIILLSYDSIAF